MLPHDRPRRGYVGSGPATATDASGSSCTASHYVALFGPQISGDWSGGKFLRSFDRFIAVTDE
jgi:hypothetical protein